MIPSIDIVEDLRKFAEELRRPRGNNKYSATMDIAANRIAALEGGRMTLMRECDALRVRVEAAKVKPDLGDWKKQLVQMIDAYIEC